MDTEIFVQNIKKYCKRKGVNQTVAFQESGVGKSFISNMVSRGSKPTVEKVQQLAEYLGVTTSELLGEEILQREVSPVRKKLLDLIDSSSERECEKLLDLINLYKGLEEEAAQRRRSKKSGPAEGETAKEEEPVFEAGTPVSAAAYICVECGKTVVTIPEDGGSFPPCGICNSNYFRRITKAFS